MSPQSWRDVYGVIDCELADQLEAHGAKVWNCADVSANAHVLVVEWPGQPSLRRLVLFPKLSQSAQGWWGLYRSLYEAFASRAQSLRRVAIFLTGATRGFLMDQDRVDYQRSNHWKLVTTKAPPPKLKLPAWMLALEPPSLPPEARVYQQYHIYERHLRSALGFRSAEQCAAMLVQIARGHPMPTTAR